MTLLSADWELELLTYHHLVRLMPTPGIFDIQTTLKETEVSLLTFVMTIAYDFNKPFQIRKFLQKLFFYFMYI